MGGGQRCIGSSSKETDGKGRLREVPGRLWKQSGVPGGVGVDLYAEGMGGQWSKLLKGVRGQGPHGEWKLILQGAGE